MDQHQAGTGYLALPDAGDGPGVLLLHAWWGLTDAVREVADRIAAAGYVVLAPDLLDGRTAETVEDAERLLAEVDPNTLAHLVRSGLHHLRRLPITGAGPCGVVGFSMGGSMAIWLSAREPDGVAAAVTFAGTQDIDLGEASCAYLGHFAEHDDLISEDDLVFFEASLFLEGHQPDIYRYAGTRQWFFEADRPEHDAASAGLAWERTMAFLDEHVPRI